MARPPKGNERISLYGKKLIELRKNFSHEVFSEWFDVSKTTMTRFLNGDSSPTLAQARNFVLNYAAANDRKVIDLNWLLDDNDRRKGPVFIGETTPVDKGNNNPQIQRQVESLNSPLNSKAMIVPRIHIENAQWWQDDRPQWVTRGAGAADSSFGQRVPDTDDIGEAGQPPEGLTLVPVEGDSMEPIVLDKQYVMIDKNREGFESDGGIVVAVVMNENNDGFGTYIKRCFLDGDYYVFESEKDYPDLQFAIDSVQRIWPVIGVWFAGRGKAPRRKHRRSAP